MAIQAKLHSVNFEFVLGGGRGGVSHDYVNDSIGFNDRILSDLQQQQQQGQLMQQRQQLLQQTLQQRHQNLCIDNTCLFSENNQHPRHQTTVFSQNITTQMETQRQEIDRFLCLQNERLRLGLLEQRKRQLATLLENYGSKAQVLAVQKDEELAELVNRRQELEKLLTGMEIESQAWQRIAKENEAMSISLSITIQQLKARLSFTATEAKDAESCCENMIVMENTENTEGKKTRENKGFQDYERKRRKQMICRKCNSQSCCVIFLPCRHLCSCKDCEALLDSCLICRMMKKASIEALF